MKKYIRWIALAAAAAAFGSSEAQPRRDEAERFPQERTMHRGAAPQQLSAEEQARRETERMTRELALDPQQVKKVHRINLRRARMMRQDAYIADREQKREEHRNAGNRDSRPDMGPGRPGTGGPGGPGMGPGGPGGRPGIGPGGMMNSNGQLTLFQIEKILRKCDADLRKTLTPEQYAQWQRMQQHGPGPRPEAAPRDEHQPRPGHRPQPQRQSPSNQNNR